MILRVTSWGCSVGKARAGIRSFRQTNRGGTVAARLAIRPGGLKRVGGVAVADMPEIRRIINFMADAVSTIATDAPLPVSYRRLGYSCEECLARNPLQRPCLGHYTIRGQRLDTVEYIDQVEGPLENLAQRMLDSIDWVRVMEQARGYAVWRMKEHGHEPVRVKSFDIWLSLLEPDTMTNREDHVRQTWERSPDKFERLLTLAEESEYI